MTTLKATQEITPEQMQTFGKLLRDKRSAAGLSRIALARRDKISDATINTTHGCGRT